MAVRGGMSPNVRRSRRLSIIPSTVDGSSTLAAKWPFIHSKGASVWENSQGMSPSVAIATGATVKDSMIADSNSYGCPGKPMLSWWYVDAPTTPEDCAFY